MNLQQAKALFFAQYYFQKVMYSEMADDNTVYLVADDLEFRKPEFGGHLLLKSVSDLTDKERTFLAMCVFGYYSDIDYGAQKDILINVSKLDADIFLNDYQINIHNTTGTVSFLYDGKEYLAVPIIAYQYMILIGVLLPFTYIDETGIPVTLFPEQIITLGWAKYQTP